MTEQDRVDRLRRDAALDAWLAVVRFASPNTSAADVLAALKAVEFTEG